MSSEGLGKLDVWRRSKDFAVRVYREVLPCLPQEEKWGLASQVRRSSQSIPANIAEGYGRYYYQENIHFCYIARGSLDETISHLILAAELGYLPDPLREALVSDADELIRMLNGYIAYLKRTRQGEKEPGSQPSLS